MFLHYCLPLNQVQALKPSEIDLICWCFFFHWIFVMNFPCNCWLVVCAHSWFTLKHSRNAVFSGRAGRPGDSGNMKDDEGRNNLKHKNLLQPCFMNFPANLSRAPELRLWNSRNTGVTFACIWRLGIYCERTRKTHQSVVMSSYISTFIFRKIEDFKSGCHWRHL